MRVEEVKILNIGNFLRSFVIKGSRGTGRSLRGRWGEERDLEKCRYFRMFYGYVNDRIEKVK